MMELVLSDNWIFNNKEWLFSGVGGVAVAYVLKMVFWSPQRNGAKMGKGDGSLTANTGNVENHTTVNVHSQSISDDNLKKEAESEPNQDIGYFKDRTRILFIDDDNKFNVKAILKDGGWIHTNLLKDVSHLDQKEVVEADILFVDIQGVGVKLGFKDAGLGLALAIKERYPKKYVVIYSAETRGNRFHEALRKADSFLPKNADPYEFQRLVEEYTIGD